MFTSFCNLVTMHGQLINKDVTCIYLPDPKRQILDSSKLKETVEDSFKSDANGRNFFKKVENTVGKGEIACYK